MSIVLTFWMLEQNPLFLSDDIKLNSRSFPTTMFDNMMQNIMSFQPLDYLPMIHSL